MPSKNSVKTYVENGYYHLYNRGVDKRAIFLDEKDCVVFLRFLKQYLLPKEELEGLVGTNVRLDRLLYANMYGEIDLLAFALMPNHFHLLLKQKNIDGIAKFMIRLCTSYAMYFNKKYERVGHLFQDQYKGVLITDDNYILHLSRYIHLNPRKLSRNKINFEEFTSYPYYLGEKRANWLNQDFILNYFTESRPLERLSDSYKKFVEEYKKEFIGEDFEELALDLKEDGK